MREADEEPPRDLWKVCECTFVSRHQINLYQALKLDMDGLGSMRMWLLLNRFHEAATGGQSLVVERRDG
jgi:hypothetical protein